MQTIDEYFEIYDELLDLVEKKFPDLGELKRDYSSEKYPSLFNDDGIIYTEDRKCLLFSTKVFLPTEEYHVLEGTEIIYEGAFYGSNVHSIVLPQSLRVIGSYAFMRCRRLESIYLPDNVEYIGHAAFDGEYVDHVDVSELNNHIQIIDTYEPRDYEHQPYKALLTCDGKFLFYLRTVNNGMLEFPLLNKVEYWGAKATYESDGRTMEIDLPTSVKTIGPYSFENCIFLWHVNFKDLVSLEEIGEGAFYNCFNLEDVVLCDSVIAIDNFAFAKCASLAKLEMPSSIQKIGTNAFWGCRGLNEIRLNTGLIEIGDDAFQCCGDIDYVMVSSTNQEILRAFNWNSHIKKLVYLDNLPVPLFAFGFADHISGDMSQYSFEYGKDMVLSKNRKVLLGYYGKEKEVIIPEYVEELSPSSCFSADTILTTNKRIKCLSHPVFCQAIKLCQEIEIEDTFFIYDEDTGECASCELWIPKNLHDFAVKLRHSHPYSNIREI